MALTDELVSLSLRPAIDVGPDPHRKPLTEAEVEMLANRLLQESTGAPLWIFAYGSLIWKPDFDAVESQHGATRGWHRSFCLQMTRWRGTRAQPGLMMALDRGGRCNGIVFRLADDDRLGQIRRLIRREVGTIEDAATVRWIPVATAHGLVRALVFWAGPEGRAGFPQIAAGDGGAGACESLRTHGLLRRISVFDGEASGGAWHPGPQFMAASEAGRR
ncbi:cation transport regulator ChaC [Rhizobium leguminosarum]